MQVFERLFKQAIGIFRARALTEAERPNRAGRRAALARARRVKRARHTRQSVLAKLEARRMAEHGRRARAC